MARITSGRWFNAQHVHPHKLDEFLVKAATLLPHCRAEDGNVRTRHRTSPTCTHTCAHTHTPCLHDRLLICTMVLDANNSPGLSVQVYENLYQQTTCGPCVDPGEWSPTAWPCSNWTADCPTLAWLRSPRTHG